MSVPFCCSERSPLLRVFGVLAPQIAALVRLRPTLAQRFVFAPPQAIHALAAYLHHGITSDLADVDVAEMLDVHHPRELLRKAFPTVTNTFYRALGSGGDRACDASVYMRAAKLASGSLAEAYLSGDPLLQSRLAFYEAVLDADPFVRSMYRALPEDAQIVDAVHNVIAMVRAHDPLAANTVAFPAGAEGGKRAALRHVLRLVDALQPPPLPFVVPEPYRHIATVGDLRRAGQKFQNCLWDRWHGPRYAATLARGDDVFIRSSEPAFVARLGRITGDHYVLSEIAGPSNARVDPKARNAFITALRASGAKIFDVDPMISLTLLFDWLKPIRFDPAQERNEAEMGFGDDDIAA